MQSTNLDSIRNVEFGLLLGRQVGWSPEASQMPTCPRKVLYLKGVLRDISAPEMRAAYHHCCQFISENNVTTLAWDGDKLAYPNSHCINSLDQKPFTVQSFTLLIPRLYATFPHLEFIFFRKPGKLDSLLIDVKPNPEPEDATGDIGPATPFTGAYPFLNKITVTPFPLGTTERVPSFPIPGNHMAVEVKADVNPQTGKTDYATQGTNALKWLKASANVMSVNVMILGLKKGGVVDQELGIVKAGPAKLFPTGFTLYDAVVFRVNALEELNHEAAQPVASPAPTMPPGISLVAAFVRQLRAVARSAASGSF